MAIHGLDGLDTTSHINLAQLCLVEKKLLDLHIGLKYDSKSFSYPIKGVGGTEVNLQKEPQ